MKYHGRANKKSEGQNGGCGEKNPEVNERRNDKFLRLSLKHAQKALDFKGVLKPFPCLKAVEGGGGKGAREDDCRNQGKVGEGAQEADERQPAQKAGHSQGKRGKCQKNHYKI